MNKKRYAFMTRHDGELVSDFLLGEMNRSDNNSKGYAFAGTARVLTALNSQTIALLDDFCYNVGIPYFESLTTADEYYGNMFNAFNNEITTTA